MAFFVETDLHGASGDASLSAPSHGFEPEPSHDGGATTYPQPLEIPDGAEIYIRNTSHFRAKLFIPCASNRCGARMQLHFVDKHNRPIDRPFYRCEREGCTYREEILFPDEMRGDYVLESGKKWYRQSDESVSRKEMETMV